MGVLVFTVPLYLFANVKVQEAHPLQHELELGLKFFRLGAFLDVIAIVLLLFGTGWKRVLPVLGAFLSIFFWYGFTLY